MCEAGRIRHHLKHNLWREECTILFVGYQAVGTLGRSIVEGAKGVKLFGETIEVRARIMTIKGLSGHADKAGLTDWVRGFKSDITRVFVGHGDDTVTDEFAEYLHDEYALDAYAPYSGTRFDLITNTAEVETVGVPITVKKKRTVSSVFERLLAAGQRLLTVIQHNEGGANKDLPASVKLGAETATGEFVAFCEADDLWTPDDTPWEFTLGQRSFCADPADLTPFTNPTDVQVRILHYWHDELMFLTGVDRATGKLGLSRPSSMLIRDIDRYYFLI